MSPRNKILVGFLFLAVTSFPAHSQANPVIKFYQDHISAVDGNRCPMTPSCSAYAAECIQKHGLAIGWVMALDRLVRCGRDEASVSPSIRNEAGHFIYDPVSANDFWWFDKKENKNQ